MPGIGLRRKTQINGAEGIRPFLLRVVAQCQEKPINEAFPVPAAHAAVVIDVALEVGKDTLQPVVGVGHPLDFPPSEQIRQVKADAGHGRAQPPMRVKCLARLGIDGALFQEYCPLHRPRFESSCEVCPVAGLQCGHQSLQFYACRQARVPSELSPDDGTHVVLAHLYPVPVKEREKRLQSVNDDAVDHITVPLDPSESIGIVRCAFMCNVLQVQRSSACGLNGYQYSAVAPEVRRVKLHHAMTTAYGIVPGDIHITQKTLHR